ncbi:MULTISPECIES: hypothetical protein [Bacillales]|jgi:hypothetical protein|uniref:Lipoprotein n=1 Tax=Brevibacillus aydinogluensis TaxID=927786 RepID=A0AA48RBJ4_9BACL|nr:MULTISPECIES: hypothetical protein [Bacillales]MBR8661651.1 hypothetical protein [Brevibacillus sp. NL20B1]NNV04513.1 hypothetical protein [Brevibacillus sp. MCWH]UFJ61462.1 hypothetical protein IRT44_00960 [Anoxybacillus sediminis]CAJ1001674.1 Lipoprotein [Brevibacillus aydinogluensis]
MWKKGSALLLALMLLLTGCAGEASLVRDAMVASLEKHNYDFEGTIKLTGDIDKLPAALGKQQQDKESAAILAAVQAGVTVKGTVLDTKNMKFNVEVNDDKLLREKQFWTGDKKAALEVVINDGKLFAKTPLDQKYLLFDTNVINAAALGENVKVDAAKIKEYQDKMNKLAIDFMKKYFATYGYKLSNAKNLGTETVQLPNGEKVKATHVAVNLDAKELINMFFYTANDAVTNQEVKKFAIEMMVLSNSLNEELLNPEKKTSEAEKRAVAEAMVTAGLAKAKQWLDTEGKKQTPEQLLEKAKQNGFHGVTLNMDFYITEEKLPVRQKSTLNVTFQVPEMKQPLTIGLESDQYSYNFNKATKYDVPSKDAAVTLDQLKQDKKALDAFREKGFLRVFAEKALEEHQALEQFKAMEQETKK